MDIQKFYSICMQGNVLRAIEYLQTFENSKNNDSDIITLNKQYQECFLNSNEIYKIDSDDSWIKDMINCYFNYFRSVLTNHSARDAENDLAANLLFLQNNKSLCEAGNETEGII